MADRLFVMLMSLLGLLAAVVLASPVIAQTAEAPDARLAEILAEARKAAASSVVLFPRER